MFNTIPNAATETTDPYYQADLTIKRTLPESGLRAIVYLRVSTQRQGASGLGLAAQREAVQRHLGDVEPIAEYREIESGRRADRPELEKALQHCELTGATLIVATLDRLSRDVSFLETIKTRCAAGGFDFKCCDMPDADAFTLGIMIQVAAYERQKISERTSKALQAAKKRGVRLGCPLGAKAFRGRQSVGAARAGAIHKTSANEWAEKRREILAGMLAEGLSYRAIAKELTAGGFTTRRGGTWSATSVSRLVSRLGLH